MASSEPEAIDVLDRFLANVIVSDLAMPEDDGYSLIQVVRARETGKRKLAQAIALTGVRARRRSRAPPLGRLQHVPAENRSSPPN